ncbi:MAG: glycosyltransferase family 2 protein [Candidatus Omnitrophota bacterium]
MNSLSISFVLPMFNERDNIRHTIETIKALAGELTEDYEIVVVDDASTDDSSAIVQEMVKSDKTIKLFCLEKNTKFGGAFAEGFKRAGKDVILYMDSDMPVRMEDIKASFPLIEKADIVTGYSKIKKGDTVGRKIISGAYNLVVQAMFGLNIKDINSGYKVVKKDVVRDVEFISRSPFVDVELFLHAKRKGCLVRQFPLIFKQRSGGKSYIARFPIVWATFVDMIKVKILVCRKPT